MKTTFLLLLFVAHADAPGEDSDLKCSQRTEAELGKDVTLDCDCEPPCHVPGENLKWKFNQSITVLAYRANKPFYNIEQDKQNADQFKDRAHLSSTEGQQDGNFPVTISKVNKSDEGTYTCHVGNKTCRVDLRLKADKRTQKNEKTPDAPGGNTSTTSGAIISIVVLAVGAVLLPL